MDFFKNINLMGDKEDLLDILKMRFGDIAPGIVEKVYELDSLDAVERLILVASNAPKLSVFLEELESGHDSFKILGERFNPLNNMMGGED